MKKLLCAVLVLMLLMTHFTAFANVIGIYEGQPVIDGSKINVGINGSILNFDVDPILQEGRVLALGRTLLNALGVMDENIVFKNGIISIKQGDMELKLTVDSHVALINGKKVQLEVPARLIDGEVLLPVRFIAEAFNWDVKWIPFFNKGMKVQEGGIVGLTSKRFYSPVTIMIPAGEDVVNIELLEKASEISGIREQLVTVPAEYYKDKVMVMVAAGEPAVIMKSVSFDKATASKLVEMGAFVAQNQYIDKYASKIKIWLDQNPEVKKEVTHEDGNIYGLPVMKANGSEYDQFYTTQTMKNPEDAVALLSTYAELLLKGYQNDAKNPIPVVIPMDEGKEFTEKLEEVTAATGINTNITAITPESTTNYILLRIAAGEPSVFFNVSLEKSLMDKMSEQGAFLPMEELVKKYAPNIQKYLDANPDFTKSIVDEKEHIYALPVSTTEANTQGAAGFFITTTVKNPLMAIKWFDYFYTEAGQKLLLTLTEKDKGEGLK